MLHIRRLSACATAALLIGILGASVMPGVAASRATPGPHVLMDESNGPLVPGVVAGGQVTRLQHAVDHFAGALTTGPVASTQVGGTTGGGPEVFGFIQNGEVTSGAWQGDLQFNLLSTIAYDAIDVNDNGTFIDDAGWQGWTSQQATNLFNAAHAAGDPVVATFAYLCGTADCDAGINTLLTTSSYESTFVSNVVAQVESRGVDGVNIDFEPATGLGGDATQFTALMSQLASALPAGDELSVDTYASAYQGGEMWDIASLAPVVSAIDVMTYGLYSGPDAQPNDPLAGPYPYTDESVVNGYLAEMPASKLLLGIPYYGVTYSTTSTDFGAPLVANSSNDITNPYYSVIQYELASCALPDLSQSYDTTSQTAWASWSFPPNGNCTNFDSLRELYYDGTQSLEARYQLVNSDHLRGIGIWSLGMDSGSDALWNAIADSFFPLSNPPTDVSAVSTASQQATLSWSPPADAAADDVSGYTVTTYNDLSQQQGSAQSVAGGSTSSTTITGLADGTPWFFSIASVNSSGTGTAAESNSVTPLSPAAPVAATSATSTLQYFLPNSDGATWQVLDESNLAFTMTPSSSEDVLLSVNSSLWTTTAGYNQDIGIEVTPSGGSPVLAGWKEAGGSAAAFSPNAAFLQAPYAMSAGTTYLVEVVWKANRPAIGATVATGAGPIGSGYSPTELTTQILPAGAQSVVSTLQYKLANSDGSTWQEMDPSRLVTSFSPAQSEDAVISGNADLWTANAGYNQDLGIFVSEDGGPSQLLAWTEAGGAATTFSPSAVSVQTVYPVVVGNTYVFSLGWKANWPAQGTAIFAGAGPIDGAYSPTRLTVYPLAPQWPGTASNLQYRLPGSDGSTWHEMDATNLAVTLTASSSESVVASGGTALFTGSPGYNQDLAVFVSVNGGTPLLLAWEESGGSAGTFSPDAATVDAVYPVTSGNTYVFSLWWKVNQPASGVTIYAGAGPVNGAYSLTDLAVVPQG